MEKERVTESQIIKLVKEYLTENPSEQDILITKIESLDVDADLNDEINRWAESAD